MLPSPHAIVEVQASPTWAQAKFGSRLQAPVPPSPGCALPSSHCSPVSRLPLPHVVPVPPPLLPPSPPAPAQVAPSHVGSGSTKPLVPPVALLEPPALGVEPLPPSPSTSPG